MKQYGIEGRRLLPPDSGNVRGITFLVEFPDDTSTIAPVEVDHYCNQIGYSGYGNNGSVRDYFFDVSDGNLVYTNDVVPYYYTADNLKTYYDDCSSGFARARELVLETLAYMDGMGFDFSQPVYDSNDDGYVDAINILYAGQTTSCPQDTVGGLWPHSG